MVVVILISVLAMLAMPAMTMARDDRMAFDYARRIADIVHRARTRAIGRGAAHMVVVQAGGGAGQVLLFEALDGVSGPGTPGPNPVSSCKAANWAPDIAAWVPGTINGMNARFVEGVDLNGTGIEAKVGLGATTKLAGAPAAAVTVYCVTPYGTSFAATNSSIATAVADMIASQRFTDVLEVTVQKGVMLGAPTGLARRVVVAGDAAPRIQSQ